ncbi:Histidine-binding periplasmic protein precursor [compost metagenome]
MGPDINDPKYFGPGAGIALRKGDAQNAVRLNAAIDAIRANGTYQQVMDKYFAFDIYGE